MLAMSRHLSWFHHRGAVFLYHDLIGYLIEMSPDLQEFVQWFGEGKTADAAEEAFGRTFGLEQVRQFTGVFADHACLLPPGTDELAALGDFYPVRGRWALGYTNPQGELRLVLGRSPETPQRIVVLEPWQAILWRLIDGEKTCTQIARELAGRTLDELEPDGDRAAHDIRALRRTLQSIASWTHSEVQWLRNSRQPMSFFAGSARAPSYLTSTMPYPRVDGPVASDPFEEGGIFDLRAYHRETIADADAQFDEVETTLSHLFRIPHPALGGATYASRMAEVLVGNRLLHPGTEVVVEVGGGTGIFAAALLDALRADHADVYAAMRYGVVEISPALQASQRARLASHADRVDLLQADGEELDLAPESVDLLISNEVIADFRTARVRRADFDDDPPVGLAADEASDPDAAAMLVDFEVPLEDAPEVFHVNIGAMRFVQSAHRVLRPGGAALITEFGDLHRYPVESTHLDHPEFSIHFGHLKHVAERVGFICEVVDVVDMLGFNPDVMVLSSTRTWFRNLIHLASAYGVSLDKIAWTPVLLAQACGDRLDIRRVEYLTWQPVGERVMGLLPREFKAMLLRKKSADTARP